MTIGIEYVGAIIGVADVAARACLKLARIIEESKESDETRSELYKKVNSLHETLTAIDISLRKRSGDVQTKPVSDDESRILQKLKSALERCDSTVASLEKKLVSLGAQGTGPNKLQRLALQMKFEVQGAGITKLERDIQVDLEAVQLLLTCLAP